MKNCESNSLWIECKVLLSSSLLFSYWGDRWIGQKEMGSCESIFLDFFNLSAITMLLQNDQKLSKKSR